ncbi:MAG: hypothetical protein ACTSPB_02015, partial [Candidatus Thorarchaeota archaeon]
MFNCELFGRKRKIALVFGAGTILTLLVLLLQQGVIVTTTGDIICEGTIENPCVSYIYITPNEYDIHFARNIDVKMYFDVDGTHADLYMMRGASWIPLDLRGVEIGRGETFVIKILGYKPSPHTTVKWGVLVGDVDVDPYWFGTYSITIDSPQNTTYSATNITPVNVIFNTTISTIKWNINGTENYTESINSNTFNLSSTSHFEKFLVNDTENITLPALTQLYGANVTIIGNTTTDYTTQRAYLSDHDDNNNNMPIGYDAGTLQYIYAFVPFKAQATNLSGFRAKMDHYEGPSNVSITIKIFSATGTGSVADPFRPATAFDNPIKECADVFLNTSIPATKANITSLPCQVTGLTIGNYYGALFMRSDNASYHYSVDGINYIWMYYGASPYPTMSGEVLNASSYRNTTGWTHAGTATSAAIPVFDVYYPTEVETENVTLTSGSKTITHNSTVADGGEGDVFGFDFGWVINVEDGDCGRSC